MTYVPDDWLLWDFWFAPRHEGDDGWYHLFHLAAPRSLPDPEMRHRQARIGHAVSKDLVHWVPRGIVFERGEVGAWDDLAIWTGSIVWHDGTYWFFYTAVEQRSMTWIQRVGLATSTDLQHWTRHPYNPVLTADPRWYETAECNEQHHEPFRDPMVVRDEAAGCWWMFVCAFSRTGPDDGRGVVALARSTDLVHWEALPPLGSAGVYGELEVPVAVQVGGRWRIVFCTQKHAAESIARPGSHQPWRGNHYLDGDTLHGPYRIVEGPPLLAGDRCDWYAARIETQLTGEPLFFAWRQFDEAGNFVYGLSNPVPVEVDADGRLRIDAGLLW